MSRQLRAIDGPLAGASWPLKKRMRLGRAADSDIQIVHDGVSRQHAHIVEVAPGEHEVVDLHSNNGTWVRSRKVERCRLSIGDEIGVVGAKFVYEEAPADALVESSAVYAVKVTSGRTLRRTMSGIELGIVPPKHERDTVENLTPPVPVPAASGGSEVPERHPVVAQRPDGSDYTGNIISDVVEYRDLRVRQARQEALDAGAHQRFEALDRTLAQPSRDAAAEGDPEAVRRQFCRFRVAFPARLRYGGQAADTTASATVLDLGAGGARVACVAHGLRVGDLVWLVIDLEMSGRSRTFVFASRVVKLYDNEDLGIIFAGAPEWDTWDAPSS
jgi:pSer/pThr/pTyr-binding forkhead associated (FHA) protein